MSIVITFLQAATREGKQLERVVMEALDKCSRSTTVTTGDTVVTRAEHQLGDTDIEDGEGEWASRDQDLHTPSLSDQPRAQETEDTEAGILATAPILIENSVLSMLTKTV